jgi:hypothetical protein
MEPPGSVFSALGESYPSRYSALGLNSMPTLISCALIFVIDMHNNENAAIVLPVLLTFFIP